MGLARLNGAVAFGAILASGCARDDAGDPALAALASEPRPSASASAQAEPAGPPPVTLDGSSHPFNVSPVAPGRPRVYSRSLRTWIFDRPTRGAARIGYLRSGASSPTAPSAAGTDGCSGGWYPVEPRGFVCVGDDATLDRSDPLVAASEEHPPDFTRKLPYIYGTVRRPGPVYRRAPTRAEAAAAEPGLEQRIEGWLRTGGEDGARYAQWVWLGHSGEPPDPAAAWADRRSDPLPTLRSGSLVVDMMRARVGYSILQTFFSEGRRYALTAALEVLPTDRLRPIQGSDFHGSEIGGALKLPFAIVRQPDARYWVRSGSSWADGGPAAYRSFVGLTGKQQFIRGSLAYETVEGRWLSDRDASRLDPAKRMPAWGKQGEKWMDINITKQTLVLYEGTRPVYATLVSSGEAGLEDPEHSTATKRGIFRIHTKHVATTMSSDEVGEEFELRDVPYVQYFDKQGYALHGAYWHDRFGIPKSHGCVNLAPEDARRIFFWTEPRLPNGWHGVLLPLAGTVVFIHP